MQRNVPGVLGEESISKEGGHPLGFESEGTIRFTQSSDGTRPASVPPLRNVPDVTCRDLPVSPCALSGRGSAAKGTDCLVAFVVSSQLNSLCREGTGVSPPIVRSPGTSSASSWSSWLGSRFSLSESWLSSETTYRVIGVYSSSQVVAMAAPFATYSWT